MELYVRYVIESLCFQMYGIMLPSHDETMQPILITNNAPVFSWETFSAT